MDHPDDTIDLTSMTDTPQGHPADRSSRIRTVDSRDQLSAELVDRLLTLVERLPHLIGLTDGRGNVEWMNAAGRRFIGASADQPLRVADLFGPDMIELYQNEIRPALERGETWSGDIEVRHDGGIAVIEAVVVGQPGPEGSDRWVSLLGVDVGAQRQREAELSHRASHDPLTGLPNRALLEERLTVARSVAGRMGAQVAVISLDLDGFKHINDSLGHAAGDLLLQQVTARLSATVRPADTVARYGGDEFMVVLHPPESTAAAVQVAQRMRDRLRSPVYQLAGATVQISASIGLTVVEHDDTADVADLIATADRAMYRAKRAGGDCVRIAGTGNAPAVGLEHLDDARIELAEALALDQIEPAFDPMVDVSTGEIRALEIVPVWNHPTRGRLGPEHFLDDAEVTGQADDIRWSAAVDGVVAARTAGVQVAVEISVSLGQLRDQEFADRLEQLADLRSDVDVCLAIAARDLAELGGGAVATAERLTAAGFGLVLSCHGTGGLPLAVLAELDLRMVKIDPEITDASGDRPSAVVLASSIGEVAQIPIAAVAVTRPESRDVLSVLGVDLVQGPVTGGPQSADQLASITRPRP